MDQLSAMRSFVRVVQTGSFSAAARETNTTQATISKRVAALETHLGVKLMMRSSRDNALTRAGAEYYEKCVSILEELDEAESNARTQVTAPRGALRVTAAFPLGRLLIAPLVADFLTRYPEIQLDMVLTDRSVDLIAEGFDIAVRAQQLEDTTLVARRLFENPLYLTASPGYLERHDTPERPEDLAEHNCIIYSHFSTPHLWHFERQGERFSVRVHGNFRCDNGDSILEAATAGVGLAVLPFWMIHSHLESDQLRILMSDFMPRPLPVHVVYPQKRYLPLRVRCFIEFLVDRFSANPVIR
jgi:DNA-binding transcriptional LysR family regulator